MRAFKIEVLRTQYNKFHEIAHKTQLKRYYRTKSGIISELLDNI